MIKIYLAHALTTAPESFRQEMFRLRQSINSLKGFRVLEFNWVPGYGPDISKNTYAEDMAQVASADLMIGVLEYPSIGLGMEIQERCKRNLPMALFWKQESSPSRIVVDCVTARRRISHTTEALVCYEDYPDLKERIFSFLEIFQARILAATVK